MIAFILDEEKAELNQTKRTWVRKMFTRRKEVGEFYTLFKQSEDNGICFYKYFWMSQYQFYMLLSKIEYKIKKQNTTFRGRLWRSV